MNNKGAKTRSSTGANRENGDKNSVPSVSSCSISLFKKTGNHRRATKRRKEKKVSTGGENSDKKLCSLRFLLFNFPSPLRAFASLLSSSESSSLAAGRVFTIKFLASLGSE